MVERGHVSVEECWQHEKRVLNTVQEAIRRGDQLYQLNGEPIGQQGSFLRGQFTLEFRREEDQLQVFHPGIEGPIPPRNDQSREWLREVATWYQWRNGDIYMGFLWVFPRPGSGGITYASHNSGFKVVRRVHRDNCGLPPVGDAQHDDVDAETDDWFSSF